MDQKFETLNADDVADLEAKRTWVRDHYDEGSRHKYETLEGPLTSISKRVERGEEVDIYDLFEDACKTIERVKREGA